MIDKKIYKNKKVLITGHTGFKGSWLSCILSSWGAEVHGLSIDVPTKPALYDYIKDIFSIDHRQDINDLNSLKKYFDENKPDFIFHLAAQPIVVESLINPLDTIRTNTLGTANMLECLRILDYPCTAVFITSDKAYRNNEWIWGYKEDDILGGSDPYSGSKGAAELVLYSYVKSFFHSNKPKIKIGIGRAGNVVGGGDWAANRIIPDAMKSWSEGKVLNIRYPKSTRPWQHVLEPLSGYLKLAEKLYFEKIEIGEAFNFGPDTNKDYTVLNVVETLSKFWDGSKFSITEDKKNNEAGLLKLNCDKAASLLSWRAKLSFEQTIQWTSEWYFNFYRNQQDPKNLTLKQIEEYF